MLKEFIEKNIDDLYRQRPRHETYNTHFKIEKDLDLRPESELTDEQQVRIIKDKRIYLDWLLEKAESKVQSRRHKLRLKNIEECKDQCQPGKPFENRNNYVEERIESTFKYFDHYSDIEQIGKDTMERTRKQLLNIQKEIEKQQKQKIKGLDAQVVAQMNQKNLDRYMSCKGLKSNLKELSLDNLQ